MFKCEDGCNGNDYDIGVVIGLDNKNVKSFLKSRLSCQIIVAGVDSNYDDEFGEVLCRMVMKMKMWLTRILQRW